MSRLVSLEEFLPQRLRSKKSKLVSFSPDTFRPEHDLKYELTANLSHHVANPNKNPGKSLSLWSFPRIFQNSGLTPVCRSVSPDRIIGKGPLMSAVITVACNTLQGYKPLQRLYTRQRKFDEASLSSDSRSMIDHILNYPIVFGSTGPGTIKISGPVPVDVHQSLEYHAYTLGLSLTDTFVWFTAIALEDQPEVPSDLQNIIETQLRTFGDILSMKERLTKSVLDNFQKN